MGYVVALMQLGTLATSRAGLLTLLVQSVKSAFPPSEKKNAQPVKSRLHSQLTLLDPGCASLMQNPFHLALLGLLLPLPPWFPTIKASVRYREWCLTAGVFRDME